jgi:hypothetical protein
MDNKEIEYVEWVDRSYNTDQYPVLANDNEPSGSIKYRELLD